MPHAKGVIGTAANFVAHVHDLMAADAEPRAGAPGARAPSMGVLDHERLYIGLDVGSTTVKAVVVDPVADEVLWEDYQRHDTKQPEKVLEFLTRIETEFPIPRERFRIFVTGSGASGLGPASGPSSSRR